MATDKAAIVARFRNCINEGKALLGAGAGMGLSAKSIEAGGADLIVIYNSGRFRMAGHGSLAGLMPFSDANQIVVEMAKEVLPVVRNAPVVAGVCATDPFRDIARFLRQLQDMGFAGVQNFPTVGLIDGNFRTNLEETGMGFYKEVEMIRQAGRLGLLTTPYVFDTQQAKQMTEAGADIVVAHMGLTTSGSIGAVTAKTLDECIDEVRAITDAALAVNPHVIVICHGGPIATPQDAEYIISKVPGLHGFYGASSAERLPTEIAITNVAKEFKKIRLGRQRS